MLSREEIWDRAERLQLTVEMRRPFIEMEDGSRQGFAVFKIFCTSVVEGEEEIGTICGGTGAITIACGDEEWYIRHDELWRAFVAAHENTRNSTNRKET